MLTIASVRQTQQLQMLAMSSPNVNPGGVETQQMQIKAPVGVRFSPRGLLLYADGISSHVTQSQVRLRLRLSYLINGQQIQDQVDFSGFPPNLTTGGQ